MDTVSLSLSVEGTVPQDNSLLGGLSHRTFLCVRIVSEGCDGLRMCSYLLMYLKHFLNSSNLRLLVASHAILASLVQSYSNGKKSDFKPLPKALNIN
jgi:hypothetical protein